MGPELLHQRRPPFGLEIGVRSRSANWPSTRSNEKVNVGFVKAGMLAFAFYFGGCLSAKFRSGIVKAEAKMILQAFRSFGLELWAAGSPLSTR